MNTNFRVQFILFLLLSLPAVYAFGQNASNSNIDLRAEDDAVDEAVEMIVKELNPLMYLVTDSNAGTIHVVMDERSNAADMQQRIRNLGTAVGPNDIDVTGSDVAAASAIAVS